MEFVKYSIVLVPVPISYLDEERGKRGTCHTKPKDKLPSRISAVKRSEVKPRTIYIL